MLGSRIPVDLSTNSMLGSMIPVDLSTKRLGRIYDLPILIPDPDPWDQISDPDPGINSHVWSLVKASRAEAWGWPIEFDS